MNLNPITSDILLIGAGKSSFSFIDYFLNHNTLKINIVAENAKDILQLHPRLNSNSIFNFSVQNSRLNDLISTSKIVVSLLPPHLHQAIAEKCIYYKKHFATASYCSPQLKSLENQAKSQNLVFMTECGLDPGIDHIMSMKMINEIHQKGGKIHSYYSFCGGLVAEESVRNNPWGYKFTWNPANVIHAGKEGAKYLENEIEIEKKYTEVFQKPIKLEIETKNYEAYPNRNSLPYIDLYQLKSVKNFIRGTIRNQDFCENWQAILQTGLTDDTNPFGVFKTLSQKEFLDSYLLKKTDYQGIKNSHFEFLYQNSDQEITLKPEKTASDILLEILQKKWYFEETDKDLVLMKHSISFRNEENEEIICEASFSEKGINQHQTAMAKTVGLPLAIVVEMILQNKFCLPGVWLPTHPIVYEEVLKKLKNQIKIVEK